MRSSEATRARDTTRTILRERSRWGRTPATARSYDGGLDGDVPLEHAVEETDDEVEGRLVLNVVVRESACPLGDRVVREKDNEYEPDEDEDVVVEDLRHLQGRVTQMGEV